MDTSQVVLNADRGGIASADMNLNAILRHSCIPEFLEGVGRVSWRRRKGTLTITGANQQYDLPTDFHEMYALSITPSGSPLTTDLNKSMPYIGEDPVLFLPAENTPAAGRPDGYYLVDRSTGTVNGAVKFNRVPDQSYATLFQYYRLVRFSDDSTNVDLENYIPLQFHFALVECLRKEIFLDRFGVGDPRYVTSEQKYQQWVEMAKRSHELAQRNYPVFSS